MASQEAPSAPSTSSPTPYSIASMRTWVVDHKLQAVGSLWATGVAGSLLVNLRKPSERFSVKLIHARLHAQGLTLAALVAAAGVEYWEHTSRAEASKAAERTTQFPATS